MRRRGQIVGAHLIECDDSSGVQIMSVKGKEKRRASRSVLTSVEIAEQWPLHWLVWEGKDKELERVLKEEEVRELTRYSLALRRDNVY